MVFAGWAGATFWAMRQALDQQGTFAGAPIVTGLGDVATCGAAGEKIPFLNHYFPGASKNAVKAAMIASVEAAGKKPDLFSPDGFVGGQMIVQAVKDGGSYVEKMVTALEGFSFDGPKGPTSVRAADHALIQNMYHAKLNKDGELWVPELVKTIPGETATPPETAK